MIEVKRQSQNCGVMINLPPLPLLLLLILSPSVLHFAAGQQPPSDSWSPPDDEYTLDPSHVDPSYTLIVIVLVLVLFISGLISLYIHLCTDITTVGGNPVIASRRGGNDRGIDKSVIETFPTFLYSEVEDLKLGKGSLECAICISEFGEKETLRLLTNCNHVFHSDCIDAWLSGHSTCPVCRSNLASDPIQLGNLSQSTHQIGTTDDDDSPPGDRNASCEVRIDIEEGSQTMTRSNSTGHDSVTQHRDDSERFTLKLPAELQRQLVARTKLKRATSILALPRTPSFRRGYRGEGSGSSRYGRMLGRSISRVVSFRRPVDVKGDVEG